LKKSAAGFNGLRSISSCALGKAVTLQEPQHCYRAAK
jgi:hypothetical protein